MPSPSNSLCDLLTESIGDIKLYQTAPALDDLEKPTATNEVSLAPMNI